MSTSLANGRPATRSRRRTPPKGPRARDVVVSSDMLTVTLIDRRTISVPVRWYPRLAHGTRSERNNWELIGNGTGIRWPDLDEDLSVESLIAIAGRRSMENERSLKQWLAYRPRGKKVPVPTLPLPAWFHMSEKGNKRRKRTRNET